MKCRLSKVTRAPASVMGMSGARVISLNRGREADLLIGGRPGRTAIDKRPVTGDVAVGPLGLAGDEYADKANHGGIDQAVYAYAREDLDWWTEQLGRELRDGIFGENVTTAGIDPLQMVEFAISSSIRSLRIAPVAGRRSRRTANSFGLKANNRNHCRRRSSDRWPQNMSFFCLTSITP